MINLILLPINLLIKLYRYSKALSRENKAYLMQTKSEIITIFKRLKKWLNIS